MIKGCFSLEPETLKSAKDLFKCMENLFDFTETYVFMKPMPNITSLGHDMGIMSMTQIHSWY